MARKNRGNATSKTTLPQFQTVATRSVIAPAQPIRPTRHYSQHKIEAHSQRFREMHEALKKMPPVVYGGPQPGGRKPSPKRTDGNFAELRAHPRHASRIAFQEPNRVIKCIQRKVRSRVLHALKLTGKGRSSKRPKRLNRWSIIGC